MKWFRAKKSDSVGEDFVIIYESGAKFRDKLYVLNNKELKKTILREAYCSPYSIHLGSYKVYQDLKGNF